MIYLELFLTFLQVGAFSFGGGYGMIALIREKVLMYGWLSEEEMLNMIAGSYSPITLIALRDSGYWGWGLFFFVWLCAIVGTIISLRKLKPHNRIETVCFVLMGLLVLVAFKPLLDAVSFSVVGWLIAEGVCYITGAVLYSFHKVKHMHSVFHIFVLLGTICHMVAVWKIISV